MKLVKETIHSNKALKEAALLKKGKFKKFLEEFHPLYCFGQSKFCRSGSKMHIVLGNQGYDAVIIDPTGDITTMEITGYIDGKSDYLDGLKITERGFSEPRFKVPKCLEAHRKDFLNLILEKTDKKRIRSYTGSDLLIVANTYNYFGVFESNDIQFVTVLKSELCKIPFQARNVYLLVLNNKPIESIDDNIFKIDFPRQ